MCLRILKGEAEIHLPCRPHSWRADTSCRLHWSDGDRHQLRRQSSVKGQHAECIVGLSEAAGEVEGCHLVPCAQCQWCELRGLCPAPVAMNMTYSWL